MKIETPTTTRVPRPRKCDIFRVDVSATHYAEVVRYAIDCAQRGTSALLDFMPVHGLVMGARDAHFRQVLNSFDVVAPDGQPVRWALNKFHNANLSDRVYGPELMVRLCRAAADENVGVYLYGSTTDVIEKLSAKLLSMYPALKIVGTESPPFRALTAEEDAAVVARINASGAGLVFIGIGCPRQEAFAVAHRTSIKAVQLCVGAAFDFHAGTKKMAPAWMQKRGLEWLYRLVQEPGRLWKRYFVNNSLFLLYAARETFRRRSTRVEAGENDLAGTGL
jgi:exopolysaccharide biosynthesis WecB/TagA/CpsF family protein